MFTFSRMLAFTCVALALGCLSDRATAADGGLDPRPFGEAHSDLDGWATGNWRQAAKTGPGKPGAKGARPFDLDVPRRDVIAFAIYTVTVRPESRGTLKLSAQLFPLLAGEPREARLEIKRGEEWVEVARAAVLYPGWDAHFRVEGWDSSRDHAYRVRHGAEAMFEGTVRRDPADKPRITVAVMSCNSSSTPGPRAELVQSLRKADPDLLFFAGDQTSRHTQHTVGWHEFGLQFRDVIRDRPTVTIPDDHDVGHPNLWGAGGRKAERKDGADGGYFYPAAYVNMVQRQQTWHLPDPVDPAPVAQGIGVFFTRLVVGGLDCAILEDRKFKTGPFGAIPEMGPRPDHITDPAYDRASIDQPGLELLGARQLAWLEAWGRDWQGVRAKTALSATAFCGAVHLHGRPDNRLLADLDCNGWPQRGRNAALRLLKAAHATHLCGDQHLAVVVQHGIEKHGDGPWSFTSPALVNTVYGRWWHPLEEKAGPNPVPGSPLPWTGDYEDGLGNKISVAAYANPDDVTDERQRADGYGIARFDFAKESITFECWPRFPVLAADGAVRQFPGWPVTVPLERPQAGDQAAARRNPQRPNVVWLTVEDMSPWIGPYGDRTVPTPNLDRLAREGVVYDNAFATSPVCAPARSALITGMFCTRIGTMHMRNNTPSPDATARNPDAYRDIPGYEGVPPPFVRCFPEQLRAAGYSCTNNAKQDYQFEEPVTVWDESSDRAHWRNSPADRPFFAVFNYEGTHEGKAFPETRRSPEVVRRDAVPLPPFYPDTPKVREAVARTYDNIAAMDRWVGERLRELEEAGLRENTVVMFFSDHGVGLPRGKRSCFDTGLRVPLIVRHPDGAGAGSREGRVVSFVDFGPTVLSLAGIEPDERLDGTPFLGRFARERADYRRGHAYANADRFDETYDRCRTVSDGRFRYTRNYLPDLPYLIRNAFRERLPMMAELYALEKSGPQRPAQWQLAAGRRPQEELYDSEGDPWEVKNLVDVPEHRERLESLREHLDAWIAATGDLGFVVPETRLVQEKIWPPAGRQPVTPAAEIDDRAVPRGDSMAYVVTLSCSDHGASIGYRLGTDKNYSGPWQVYAGPFEVPANRRFIEVQTHRIGHLPTTTGSLLGGE